MKNIKNFLKVKDFLVNNSISIKKIIDEISRCNKVIYRADFAGWKSMFNVARAYHYILDCYLVEMSICIVDNEALFYYKDILVCRTRGYFIFHLFCRDDDFPLTPLAKDFREGIRILQCMDEKEFNETSIDILYSTSIKIKRI